jgi:hypothetical protein
MTCAGLLRAISLAALRSAVRKGLPLEWKPGTQYTVCPDLASPMRLPRPDRTKEVSGPSSLKSSDQDGMGSA